MKSTRRWQQLLLNSLAIILGNALYSLAVALFLEPAGLITGGATGIALAFGRLTGLSVSGFLFLFNMSMLVWGWAVLGKKFALNTLASSVLSPAFLGLFERLLDGRVLTEDIFLCTIFSGLGIGVALGMVIRAGASTGGMDIPPLVLQKWFRWPVSITMMLFDIAILLVQAAFSQPEQVLYGIVLVITHTIVMDKMLMLGASRTEVKIVSSQSDAICAAILARTQWGVEDEAVLSAIACHTAGKPGMSRLDKIVYLADMTSAERDWPGVNKLRRLERKDLDLAMLAALKRANDFVLSEGKPLDPMSKAAYDEIKAEVDARAAKAG